ncbi:HIT domain containing protein [Asbolus verrucosus]|uniref:bis(5'-adenosyl)-triphosphatase n=1 Tax=Asbolus verrucosus TaxID=1661398 RepID=A0A482VQI5_ASBVE|nr:HIT domain containing protein [Asbolus verrucosus]
MFDLTLVLDVLISSIRPAKRLENLSREEVADLFHTAVKVQKVMEAVNLSDSTTVCVQDGKNAGQTVPHVHIHILPRQPHDFARNDEIYDKLAQHDRENNPEPIRSIAEMSEEAQRLRNYFIEH